VVGSVVTVAAPHEGFGPRRGETRGVKVVAVLATFLNARLV
jgi:hypothetical protein